MGVAIPIVAAGVAVASSIAGGLAARRNKEMQSAALSRNAQTARENAGYTRLVASQQGGLMRDQTVRVMARTMAQAAGQNLSLDSGSLRDIVKGSYLNSEVKVQSHMNDAWRRALGYETQADTFDMQAAEAHREGNIALVSGFLGVGSAVAQGYMGASDASNSSTPSSTGTGLWADVRDADNGNWWD